MPLTLNLIDLAALIPAWLGLGAAFKVFVAGLQHKTEWQTRQDVHGALVLHATQLEAIFLDEKGEKGKKHEHALMHHASAVLIASFEQALGVSGIEAIGKVVGTLRNEIAHVGKPQKMLRLRAVAHFRWFRLRWS